ncbi:S-layer domain-containing protein [Thermaerobacter marianensis DSM 12885]|uniref:S-layer domain-containing protein n=1 Tax=Thermaerobacter marianensis (strain ATCC 700841 / DSM 12885 / JCM 10246 / 7p75a) TaxID=644966 RepID=E6SL87_THEM7|nr:S-layer homology domain-containing protein [Thermaerobacter marianensis]ADU51318.1 S-layer domain-containing protein [Thermaerobacter marianensis DSM 12885]
MDPNSGYAGNGVAEPIRLREGTPWTVRARHSAAGGASGGCVTRDGLTGLRLVGEGDGEGAVGGRGTRDGRPAADGAATAEQRGVTAAPAGCAASGQRCFRRFRPRPPRPVRLVPVLAGVLLMAVPAQAADPWYVDLGNHWAADEVRVLWEEGVTDGYLRTDALGRPQAYFLPNAYMERAQFAVLLAKVMGLEPTPSGPPVYPDVPPGYRAGGDLDAYPWIQAGSRAGLFPDEPGRAFRPAAVIRRDEAVAMLVYALDLSWYAEGLPEARVAALLGRFDDAHRIRPALRRAVAAAIDLAIVVGYGDGFLRPDRSLTRAEGATLIYKAAIMRVGARPPSFSPDGDGADDTTRLEAEALLNGNQKAWKVEILDTTGRPVRVWTGTRLPASWDWDGRDAQGQPVPAGVYLLRGELTARQGTRFVSAIEPVEVIYRRLAATASPPVVEPGDVVQVAAFTEGPAEAVHLEAPGSTRPAPLAAVAPGTWWGHWTVPQDLEPGTYTLTVIGRFPGLERRQALSVQVLPPLWIRGEVHPDRVAPGTAVTVTAEVPASADAVELHPPGGGPAVPLVEAGPGRWEVTWTVPRTAPPGSVLALELEARRGTRRATAQLQIRVVEPGVAARPVFHLTH